jgi:hypothetical protein
MVDYLVDNIIGYTPFKGIAKQAVKICSLGSLSRVFELETDFVKLGEGLTGGAGSKLHFFTTEKIKHTIMSNNRYGDYINRKR